MEGRVAPIDNPEVKQGFVEVVQKMFTHEKATIIREHFLDFAMFNDNIFSIVAKADLLGMAQRSPGGWWRMYGDKAPEICTLSMRLLSAKRNWSTYSFIHTIKRNRFTSKRVKKLVYVHSSICLLTRKAP
jgi:hypothetical protein